MASVQRQIIFPLTALVDEEVTGRAVALITRSRSPIGYLTVADADAATTVAAKIQHSPDGENAWTDYLTFTTTAAGASANEVVRPEADAILPHARAVIVLGGATTEASVSVSLYTEPF